jgi:Leucine-rich repeat (LRR) protein
MFNFGCIVAIMTWLAVTTAIDIDLSERQLNETSQIILLTHPSNDLVKRLDISMNDFHQLEGDWDLSNLVYLDASFNDITSVKLDFLCAFVQLVQLKLSHNMLTTLPFPCIALITRLDVAFNKIENLPKGTFLWYSQLSTLDISGNALLDISGLSELKDSLIVLNMANTTIVDLGNALDSFKRLQSLNLQRNKLTELRLCDMESPIANLFLGNNSFNEVPELSCVAETLFYFDMKGNMLTVVTDGYFEGVKLLRYLDVSRNAITHLALCYFGTVDHNLNDTLMGLFVHMNQLSSSGTRVRCAATTKMTLSSNPLNDWPSVEYMESLQRLELEDTGLSSVPSEHVLQRLQGVDVLLLDRNRLTWDDVRLLIRDAVSLQKLGLSHNMIETMNSAFLFDTPLIELDLAFNTLKCLPKVIHVHTPCNVHNFVNMVCSHMASHMIQSLTCKASYGIVN